MSVVAAVVAAFFTATGPFPSWSREDAPSEKKPDRGTTPPEVASESSSLSPREDPATPKPRAESNGPQEGDPPPKSLPGERPPIKEQGDQDWCSLQALKCNEIETPEYQILVELNNAAMQARKEELNPRKCICLATKVVMQADTPMLISIAHYELARGWEMLGCSVLAYDHIQKSLDLRLPSDPGWSIVCSTCARLGQQQCPGCP